MGHDGQNSWPFLLEELMNCLREIRAIKRITQFRLSLVTGIHQSKISLIENDLVEARQDEKEKIAQELGTMVEEIWEKKKGSILEQNSIRREEIL